MDDTELSTPGDAGGEDSADMSHPQVHPPMTDPRDLPPSQRGIKRKPMVPAWALIAVAAILLASVAAVVAIPLMARTARVEVPSVAGMDFEAAKTRLEAAGLTVQRGDERFSAEVPEGSVIEQTPPAGEVVSEGDMVTLVLSAGSEVMPMPDVVGKGVDEARSVLSGLGLAVRVKVVPSESASGTVIESVPAPGGEVRTSDVVHLTVAGSAEASTALLPYELKGLSFAIDPSPTASGTTDVPLEVARRLRSLLEASGATVTVTRSFAGPAPSPADRSKAASDSKPSAMIGLSILEDGEPGIAVSTVPASPADAFGDETRRLAQQAASELRDSSRVVRVLTEADEVNAPIPAARIRVVLGSASSREDGVAFRDPRWSDEVARALYRAIGEVYERR